MRYHTAKEAEPQGEPCLDERRCCWRPASCSLPSPSPTSSPACSTRHQISFQLSRTNRCRCGAPAPAPSCLASVAPRRARPPPGGSSMSSPRRWTPPLPGPDLHGRRAHRQPRQPGREPAPRGARGRGGARLPGPPARRRARPDRGRGVRRPRPVRQHAVLGRRPGGDHPGQVRRRRPPAVPLPHALGVTPGAPPPRRAGVMAPLLGRRWTRPATSIQTAARADALPPWWRSPTPLRPPAPRPAVAVERARQGSPRLTAGPAGAGCEAAPHVAARPRRCPAGGATADGSLMRAPGRPIRSATLGEVGRSPGWPGWAPARHSDAAVSAPPCPPRARRPALVSLPPPPPSPCPSSAAPAAGAEDDAVIRSPGPAGRRSRRQGLGRRVLAL